MTLQERYNLIKEGKDSKDVFLKESKSLFPNLIRNAANFKEAITILKQKSIISEGIGGVISIRPINNDWFSIFKDNISEAEAKATEKEPTKDIIDMETKSYNYKDEKNIDNLFGAHFLTGYYAEIKDPKNADKTVDEIKSIVAKNIAKDNMYYTKEGQFGVKGLGYTTEAPGLGTPKEPKGKYKSSGYGDLKENKIRSVIRNIIKEELKKKTNFESLTPKNSEGIKQAIKKFDKGVYDIVFTNDDGIETKLSATNTGTNVELNPINESSKLSKAILFCSIVAGLVSCQKEKNKEIYGYSVKTHYTQYNLKSPNKNKKITLITPTGIKVVSADSTAKTEESSPTGAVGFLKKPTNEELEIFKFATAIAQEKNRIVSPNYVNDFEAKNVDIYPVDFYSTNLNSYFTDIKSSTDFKNGVKFGKENPAEFERQTGLSASILNNY
jgi:hypothetical protein